MDLSTTYCGLDLSSPLVVSSCPLSEDIAAIKQMEDAGAGAVVLYSLFEEQIRHEDGSMAHYLEMADESFSEALSYFPEPSSYKSGPSTYLELVSQAKAAVDIPVIGSINGITHEGWVDYAKRIQEAGAAAIELNVYWLPTAKGQRSGDVEQRYVDVLRAVKASVSIPVAIKLGPFFSSLSDICEQLVAAKADALVLFNRFYQPDFDLDQLDVVSNLQLSTPVELRLPLLWISVLSGRLDTSLAATTGIHSGYDLAKTLLAGADCGMAASAILQRGIGHIKTMLDELKAFMSEKEYDSVSQMKGAMSQARVAKPEAFERANYIKMLASYGG